MSTRVLTRRAGFSLIEAMTAISLTALAGSVLLVAIETTAVESQESAEQTIAAGLARQLLDEALCLPYRQKGTTSASPTALGPSTWEAAGAGRERYGDIDDYHGFVAAPPEDVWGQPLGQADQTGAARPTALAVPADFFANWKQEVTVRYLDPTTYAPLASGQASFVREIRVRILRVLPDGSTKELANEAQVFGFVPMCL